MPYGIELKEGQPIKPTVTITEKRLPMFIFNLQSLMNLHKRTDYLVQYCYSG
jgi:hypothetical protein